MFCFGEGLKFLFRPASDDCQNEVALMQRGVDLVVLRPTRDRAETNTNLATIKA